MRKVKGAVCEELGKSVLERYGKVGPVKSSSARTADALNSSPNFWVVRGPGFAIPVHYFLS